MARKKRRRKKIFGLFGRAPMHCRTDLSHCMKGGGRRKAGPCMREFQRCRKGA